MELTKQKNYTKEKSFDDVERLRGGKQRIAHKLGVSSADLHEHLQNDMLTYLYNDTINPKK